MGGSALRAAWPSSFPELTTARLRLRAPLPGDAAALLGILGDPEVTRHHNMPTITTLAEAQAALERLEQRYADRDTIRWAIELAGRGEMIGTVGLLRFDFQHGRAEVGYELARCWWGRGLASEAAAAVIRYGCSILGLHRIEAGVLPGNDASVRVLRKLGFLEEGTRRDYLHFKGRFHSFRVVQPARDRQVASSPRLVPVQQVVHGEPGRRAMRRKGRQARRRSAALVPAPCCVALRHQSGGRSGAPRPAA